ncbi:possible Protein of unknown function DUF42 [Prochlorococcus marinus str. MIT 9313]|uniref:Uncharacterized protein n=1 Tax=Prochlorococcus marinus (strain MIT 9313) TaxID=74547 RepID=Q7V6Z9_PROMM|nr:possible Protein of unknown function DUF42 [Prochlorococcus marinus str. MIT 9313]
MGFQGALQRVGRLNQAGIDAFLPIAVGENSVFFIDALVNANFSFYDNYSSIINTVPMKLRCFGKKEGTLMLPGFYKGVSGMGLELLEDDQSRAVVSQLISAGPWAVLND